MESRNGIQIYVALKHMGNVTKKVKEHPFWLSQTPSTLRELIEEAVKSCLRAYRERAKQAETLTPLSDEQFDAMQEIGKFAFGVQYNETAVDQAKAIETAMDAVADGLVRVFRGSEELTDLNQTIELTQGEVFTFVKLTMLTGRMW